MSFQFYSYEDFDIIKVTERFKDVKFTIVYDKKTDSNNREIKKYISIENTELLDVNTFKFLSWKNIKKEKRKLEKDINENNEAYQYLNDSIDFTNDIKKQEKSSFDCLNNSNIAVFYIKNLSNDFLYSFFKDTYTMAEFYTNDEKVDKLCLEVKENIKIIIYEPLTDKIVSSMKNQFSKEFYDLYLNYLNFIGLNFSFVNYFYLNKNNKILIADDSNCQDISARNLDILGNYNCMVYFYDDKFVYSNFEKIIFFIPSNEIIGETLVSTKLNDKKTSENSKNALDQDTKEDYKEINNKFYESNIQNNEMNSYFLRYNNINVDNQHTQHQNNNKNIIKLNLFNKLNQLILASNHDYSKLINTPLFQILNTFQNFSYFLMLNNTTIFENFSKVLALNINNFPYLKIQEVKISKITFPLESARLFLDHIVFLIRSVFEDAHLFLKNFLPIFDTKLAGYYEKEYISTLSFPGIFIYEVTSDSFISKKEAINDASCLFIKTLISNEILDDHGNVINENLLNHPPIQKLFKIAFNTTNQIEIRKIYNDFIIDFPTPKLNTELILKNGKILLIQPREKNLIFDLFKKKYMVDIEKEILDDSELSLLKNSNKESFLLNNAKIEKNCNDSLQVSNYKSDLNDLEIIENEKLLELANSFFNESSPLSQMEKFYRKIPDCLKVSSNSMNLYSFSNSSIGILCSEFSIEKTILLNEINESIQISCSPVYNFSQTELQIIYFFQIIFFKMHGEILPSEKQTIHLYYYAVPITENKTIDWKYLNEIFENFFKNFAYSEFPQFNQNNIEKDKMNANENYNLRSDIRNDKDAGLEDTSINNVFDKTDLSSTDKSLSNINKDCSSSFYEISKCSFLYSNILWNPFTSEFIIFDGIFDKRIEEYINDETTYIEYVQNKYNLQLNKKDGYVMFKGRSIDEISSIIRKEFQTFYVQHFNCKKVNLEDISKIQFSITNFQCNTPLGYFNDNDIINKEHVYLNNKYLNEHLNHISSNIPNLESSNNDKSINGYVNKNNRNFQNDIDNLNSTDNDTLNNQANVESDSLTRHLNDKIINNLNSAEYNKINIYAAECCFITPLKKSLLVEMEIFKRNFGMLENLLIAIEMKKEFDLNVDNFLIVKSFTHRKCNQYCNYERLEFLGDSVLKFLTTSHLYLTGHSMDVIVSLKDSIICNSNLFKHTIQSNIYKYLKSVSYNKKMLQTPYIEGNEHLKKYFNVHSTFNSDNYFYYATKSKDPALTDIKIYADIIEALIGSIFLDSGLINSFKFLCKLSLLKSIDEIENSENINEKYKNLNISYKDFLINDFITLNNNSVYKKNVDDVEKMNNFGSFNNMHKTDFPSQVDNKKENDYLSQINLGSSVFNGFTYVFFVFQNLISSNEIFELENIIGYHFKNKGNLERAIVHPSYTCIFNSTDFQFLELIGDSALDLFVNYLVYQNTILETPLLLHSAKKSYVNNNSLRKIFYQYGFSKYIKAVILNTPNSKAYSDVIESIIGAIIIDLQWDYLEFIKVMNFKIKDMLEECKEELNLN